MARGRGGGQGKKEGGEEEEEMGLDGYIYRQTERDRH